MGEYIPQAPINDEAKKANQNLPGMGGVFNLVNLHTYHYAGNNPVKYTDPDGKYNIDFTFTIQQEGGQALVGYVPWSTNSPTYNHSGVTIASGFDLGQQNQFDLQRHFGSGTENADLRNLFTPYLGLQRQDAVDFLQANPLVLTQAQADRVDSAVLAGYVGTISSAYNATTGGDFTTLPRQAQTALFDLGYNLGSGGIPNNLMQAIHSGNYSGAADILESMTSNPTRRLNEANLLRQLPNTNQDSVAN
jgi:hypothetical protein